MSTTETRPQPEPRLDLLPYLNDGGVVAGRALTERRDRLAYSVGYLRGTADATDVSKVDLVLMGDVEFAELQRIAAGES